MCVAKWYLFESHGDEHCKKKSKIKISSVRRGGTYTNQLALRMGAAKLLLSLVYGIISLFTLDFILKISTRFVSCIALNSKGKYLLLTFKEKNAKLLFIQAVCYRRKNSFCACFFFIYEIFVVFQAVQFGFRNWGLFHCFKC